MLFRSAGEAHLPQAILSLDEGIGRLGPVISLMQPALELEIRLKRFDAALERIERIRAALPRAETWLARRGEVLVLAGRREEARESFVEALAKIAALTERQRSTQAVRQLEKGILERLNELNSPSFIASH